MADKKFTNFNPNVNMPGGIGPVNKDIPLIESHYILVEDKASTDLTARLDAKLDEIDEALSAINGDGTSGGLSDKVDKSSITTTAPATTNTDAQVPSTKSVATALATKPTGTLTTSVAASGTAEDTKIPTEKAVRDAIDSKTITVDSALNTTSTNAIQNKVVKEALDTKQDTLTFDSAPTASSTNPVTSGGVKTALDAKQNILTFDSAPTASSSNPVTSGGIKTALDAKQDTLTFDSAPTANSTKPVTSGGVKTALDAKQDTLTFDSAPTAGSSKPVTSGGIKTALDTKQNTLTFDTVPVTGSVNPVTSAGVKNAITSAANANLGAMQAQYDEFVADAQDILDTAATLSNGMVACADISAETTPGDTRLLIYTGTTDSTYTNGHWYYNSAAADAAPVWTDGGAVGTAPTVDNTLSTPGAAADAKSVGDAIDDIVTISSTEPDGTGNKIWIKDTATEEVQVPTFEEHIAKANKADISINNEDDLTSASKAYAIGDHFYINDTNINSQTYGASTLYKATAAIAAGDPITVGTNCIAVQLATEVTELSNDLDSIKDETVRSIKQDNAELISLDDISNSTIMLSTQGITIGGATQYGTIISFNPLSSKGNPTTNGAVQFWSSFLNNDLYCRKCYNSTTWTEWEKVTSESYVNSAILSAINALKLDTAYMISLPHNDEAITDASILDNNRIMLATSNKISNVPSSNGTIITFCPLNNNGVNTANGSIQLWIEYSTISRRIYVRNNVNSQWKEWKKLITEDDNIITSDSGMMSMPANQSDINDANDFNVNRVVAGLSKNNITNVPTSYGVLINFAPLNANGVNTKTANLQFWLDYLDFSKLYFRANRNNAWEDWKELVDKVTIETMINNQMASCLPDMSMFQTMGVLGDSFASGYMGVTKVNQYVQSWGQVLGRKHGIDVFNYSYDGQTARGWITAPTRGLSKLLEDNPKDLYVIAFGLNDAYLYTQDNTYIGSESDMSDDNYDSNPNTFYGCMGRIIKNIQAHAPTSKIVLSTTPYGKYGDNTGNVNRAADRAINEAITAIATHYSLPLVVVLSHPLFYSAEYKQNMSNNGSHPSATMYAAMANAYEELIRRAMVEYDSYFADYNTQRS